MHRSCRRANLALTLGGVLLLTGALTAGPDPVLTVTDAGPAPPYQVSILLDHTQSANGWGYGLCHDPVGLAVHSAGLGAVGSTVNNGGPPDFAEFQFEPGGWAVGVVVNFTGMAVLPAGTGLEIGEAVYAPVSDGAWTVCPCATIGDPPMFLGIVYSGATIVPAAICGTVTVDFALVPQFIRGDANDDGLVDIADPVEILAFLFDGGPTPPCRAAQDFDGGGAVDIGDPIQLLEHLFAGGPPPVMPYPGCGNDPGGDCESPTACP